ncbi:MAG: hypothetical protein QOG68_2393, partial [Solirubrobacteraceae bacterium]|nr:hypothetical protein [Solirubrobacteraceae bacterium]
MARTPGRTRAGAAACAAAAIACALGASASSGQLSTQLQQVEGKQAPLKSQIQSDNAHIHAYQVRIADLQERLAGLELSLRIQERLLARDKSALRSSRARLLRLRTALRHDSDVLAQQVRAQYEAPEPDLVTVVLDAHGFSDLLERVDRMQAIGRHNADIVRLVRDTRAQVRAEAVRLTALTRQQQRTTDAVLVERDSADNIRLQLVSRQAVYLRSRQHTSARLAA